MYIFVLMCEFVFCIFLCAKAPVLMCEFLFSVEHNKEMKISN